MWANLPTRINSLVVDVHKTLLSITRAADVGYECHLNAGGIPVGHVHTRKHPDCKRRQSVHHESLGQSRP